MKSKEVIGVFTNAIEILKNNKIHMVGTKKFPTHLTDRDIHQRADEICLLYSEVCDISFNHAKELLNAEELFVNLEESER